MRWDVLSQDDSAYNYKRRFLENNSHVFVALLLKFSYLRWISLNFLVLNLPKSGNFVSLGKQKQVGFPHVRPQNRIQWPWKPQYFNIQFKKPTGNQPKRCVQKTKNRMKSSADRSACDSLGNMVSSLKNEFLFYITLDDPKKRNCLNGFWKLPANIYLLPKI